MDIQVSIPARANPAAVPPLYPVARIKLTVVFTGTITASVTTNSTNTPITIPPPNSAIPTGTPSGDTVITTARTGALTFDMYLNSDFDLAGPNGYAQTITPAQHPRAITFTLNGGTISEYRFSSYSIPSSFNNLSATRRLSFNPPTLVFTPPLPPGTPVNRHEIDIILVLDRSGSMGSSVPAGLPGAGLPKMDSLHDAIGQFIDLWTMEATAVPEDRLGLIWFSTTAAVVPFGSPATNLSPRGALWNTIKSTVNSTGPTGSTALGDGVTEAFVVQEGATPQNPDTVLLLLSDGMQNTGNQIQEDVPSVANPPDNPVLMTFFDTNAGGWRDVVTKQIPVQSVGLGASGGGGSAWEVLLSELAEETGGNTELTWPSTIDMGFHTKLVQVMKGNTLSKILEHVGMLGSGDAASAPFTFEIDSSVTQFIVVLGWRVSNQRVALSMRVNAPDGTTAQPDDERSEPYYQMEAFNLASRPRGTYSVEVLRTDNAQGNVEYHLSVLVTEGSLAYDIVVQPNQIATGTPIDIGALVSRNGEPWTGLNGRIKVDIEAPPGALGTFLFENDVPDDVLKNNPPESNPDSFPTASARKINYLLEHSSLSKIILPRQVAQLDLVEGTPPGAYSARFTQTSVPGLYKFRVHLEAEGDTGTITRVEEHQVTVNIRELSPTHSTLNLTMSPAGGYVTTMVLRDRFGNVLPPDFGNLIKIRLDGKPIDARITDPRASGNYTVRLDGIGAGENPTFSLDFHGKNVIEAPIKSLGDQQGPSEPTQPEDWLARLLRWLLNLLRRLFSSSGTNR